MKRLVVTILTAVACLVPATAAQAHFTDSAMAALNKRLLGVCVDHGKWPWECQYTAGWTGKRTDAYGFHYAEGYWWTKNKLTWDDEKWRATFGFIHGHSISVCCKKKVID